MIRLADVLHGRQNNLHLLRLLAASTVLFSHAFSIATGDPQLEPLRVRLGYTPGAIAVDVFFLVSGMLVTMSLVRRNDVVDFLRARFFRIWPGLVVSVFLTAFVLGPLLTTLSLSSYFSSRALWSYTLSDCLVLNGMLYVLPGVFARNPLHGAVNDSLWTLPLEVTCYLLLLAAWGVVRRATSERFFALFIALTCCSLLIWHCIEFRGAPLESSRARLDMMFFCGVAAYLFRNQIVLSHKWLLAALAAIVLSSFDADTFAVAYTLAIPYVVLCVAYLPSGKIRHFDALGDYSYGVYIYAFPIGQTVVHLLPGIGVLELFSISWLLTMAVAIASWHIVEKPALHMARSSPLAGPSVARTPA
jgi:peptidoglycan/LPS O-acetylase OafA/YrhL